MCTELIPVNRDSESHTRDSRTLTIPHSFHLGLEQDIPFELLDFVVVRVDDFQSLVDDYKTHKSAKGERPGYIDSLRSSRL